MRMRPAEATAVCLVVENMTVPTDRRVWAEARALKQAGYAVSVVCPKGKTTYRSSYEELEGIHIYRHRGIEAKGAAGYLLEYGYALAAELYLVLKVFARTRFRVLQGCNPPDTIFLIALLLRPFGVRYVFDHHDLSPELIEAKFGKKRSWLAAAARFLERCSFRTAEVTLATNESFKEVALGRGGKTAEQVFVVRNCPERAAIEAGKKRRAERGGARFQVIYVGFMGKQDGLELLLEAIDYLVHSKQRRDTRFVLVGGGTMLPELRAYAEARGLNPFVEFTGPVPHEEVLRRLQSSDAGVAPDPKTAMNDQSTMIKIFEYMAFGLPVVLFDLKEGRRAAGPAALYARPNDSADFAEKVNQLLECSELRQELGNAGRKRIEEGLNWETEKENLLKAYRAALKSEATPARAQAANSEALVKRGA